MLGHNSDGDRLTVNDAPDGNHGQRIHTGYALSACDILYAFFRICGGGGIVSAIVFGRLGKLEGTDKRLWHNKHNHRKATTTANRNDQAEHRTTTTRTTVHCKDDAIATTARHREDLKRTGCTSPLLTRRRRGACAKIKSIITCGRNGRDCEMPRQPIHQMQRHNFRPQNGYQLPPFHTLFAKPSVLGALISFVSLSLIGLIIIVSLTAQNSSESAKPTKPHYLLY